MPGSDGQADVLVTLPDGTELTIEVKSLARVTPADVDRITGAPLLRQGARVVVADQVTPAARDLLAAAGWGWLDRRGQLAIDVPNMVIETEVPALVQTEGKPIVPTLVSSVGLDVGVALLTDPGVRRSIRDLVAFTGRSLGAVHRAVAGLTSEGLVSSSSGLPLPEALFWEAAARWRPQRVAISETPTAFDAERTDQLQLGLREVEGSVGWAVADVAAANVYGAPAPIAGNAPPDFYVPDGRVVRVARSMYGEPTHPTDRGATVAVAPVAWVCQHRIDAVVLGNHHPMLHFGFVHPVVAALDLASDAGRGREILRDWNPPEPYVRVW
jgi:hypothetical protein